jgi:desulfoferrodoxin (superoxide reductase-like protein)
MNASRRAFLGTATTFSALGLLRLLPGCREAIEPIDPTEPTPSAETTRGATLPTDDDELVTQPAQATAPVDADLGNAEWIEKANALESANVDGKAYTADAPGPFTGKERAHVPVLTVQSDGVAVVVVNHVMDAGAIPAIPEAGTADAADAAPGRPLHYVTTIWIKDERGRVLFMKAYAPSEPAPPFIAMKIPNGVKTLTAFEHCNLHGVWASPAI